MTRRFGVSSVLVLVWCASASAAPSVTRADLARSYLRLEQALAPRAAKLSAAERSRLERTFDRATIAFFSGAYVRAVQAIDGLTRGLMGEQAPPAVTLRLGARILPVRGVVGMAARPSLTLVPLYAAPKDAAAVALTVRLVRDGKQVAQRTLTVDPAAPPARLAWDALGRLAPGAYAIELGADGRFAHAGRWTVVARAPADVRRRLGARLSTLTSDDPALVEARACCRARLGLLRDAPNEADLATVLVDPQALTRDLEQEVAALERGRDPYARRVGELWRALTVGKTRVPFRLFAPPAAATRRLPLVVAFHGMGGDENMFRYGYGGGELIRQAKRRELLVVTPRTEAMLRSPAAFDRLLEVLGREYRIDRTRIYLIGHSMGTGAVLTLARTRAKRVAAAVCFSGRGTGGAVPTLVIRGSQDPFGAMAFGRSKPKGELRILQGYGHTLLVGEKLGPALDWLVRHRRRVYY